MEDRSNKGARRLHFMVFYLTGGREGQVIVADDYVDDGRFIVFREEMPDGSFCPVMGVRANVVDHIETLQEDALPVRPETPPR